jgi:hypothetical protein
VSPCPWGRLTLQGAAARGHLHVLQWAWEHGCPSDRLTSSSSSSSASTSFYTPSPSSTSSPQVCSWAAVGGHLHVLQWAREHGFPWNTATCRGAAMNGHMGVLRWSGGAG